MAKEKDKAAVDDATPPEDGKGGPENAAPPVPPLMKGVVAGRNPGSVFGPPAPSDLPGPRGRLCKLLGLKTPSDAQLFEDAADLIERLREELGK